MKIIATDKAPAAIGPYSQGYEVGGLVITSGQIPVDPATGEMPATIEAQARSARLWPSRAARTWPPFWRPPAPAWTRWSRPPASLADIADFAAFNEVYAKYFTSKPARSCVAVKQIPQGRPL